MRPWLRFKVYVIFYLVCATAPIRAQTGDVQHVHDPCIIKEENSFYVFSTGDGIPIRRSSDLVTWKTVGAVFNDVPDWALEAVPGAKPLWAPDISYFDGVFHLYYAVSTFGSNQSCIGLATNHTLDPASKEYRWVDHGMVISSTPGRDNWNAIDPNVVLDEENQPWLSFGSFWSGIKLCRLDAETGLRSASDRALYSIAGGNGGPIEAPFIVRKSEYFYLFVSLDYCCKGKDSTYKVMVGRSKRVTGPYVDRDGKPLDEGGGTPVLAGYGRIRGPGHNAVLLERGGDWLVHHFYDADADGVPTLQIRPLLWATDGWPLAGEPVPYGEQVKDNSVTGRWEHSVDGGKPNIIMLLANGHVDRPDGSATWSLNGSNLQLRWPGADAPNGIWIDECVVSRDGRWFAGRNQTGMIVRGVRIEDKRQ